MPKVTSEYLAEKRNYIIDCTGEILKEKPLYLITMRDIIVKAGFSQGAIYRYYAGLDEIYVDFINRHTAPTSLEQRLDTVLSSGQSEKVVLAECLKAMGVYIAEMMESVAGKAFFELTVLYAYDIEKRDAIYPRLKVKQSIEYAQHKIVEYVLSNVEKGVFHPLIPVSSIVQFVSIFTDGTAQSVATNAVNTPDIVEMYHILAQAILGFLEG